MLSKIVNGYNMSTDKLFKDVVWNNKDLFKRIFFFKDKKYFTSKKGVERKTDADKYYISTDNLITWCKEVVSLYSHQENYCLFSDLMENRQGQYSNGTLYSSSRLIAEVFADKNNRNAFLKIINARAEGIDLNENKYYWYLEYRLPIKGIDGNPPQLDLVAKHKEKKVYICVESKMKEIYSNYYQDFRPVYRKILQSILPDTFEIKDTTVTKEHIPVVRLLIKNETKRMNFYYKQQICHFLGMKELTQDGGRVIFANFVFNPEVMNFNNSKDKKTIIDKYINYKNNEQFIMEKKGLAKYFNNNGSIEYAGLITHDEITKYNN